MVIRVWVDKGLPSVVAVEIKGYLIEIGQELVFMNRKAQKENELMVIDRYLTHWKLLRGFVLNIFIFRKCWIAKWNCLARN